jgi:O-antigen/teichoic acid export membrane protein
MKRKILSAISRLNKFYLIKLLSSFLIQMSSMFLVYLLPASEYGFLALLMSISSLMFVVTSGWNNGALVNLGSKSFSEKGSYLDIVIYRTMIIVSCMIFVSICYVLLENPITSFLQRSTNYSLVYVFFIGLIAYDFSYQLLYPGNKDFLQSTLELLSSVILIILMFTVVKTVEDYVYVYTIVNVVFALFTVGFFLKFQLGQHFTFVKSDIIRVLKYSLWQILSVVGIYMINVGMNYIFVFNKISPADIGQYNFAFKLFSGFSAFFALFGIVIPKWIHNAQKSNIASEIKSRILKITLFLSVFYIVIAIILKPFLQIIGKSDYKDSSTYFILLFPAFIFMAYCNLMNTVVANTQFYKYAQYTIAIQVVILLSISFPLVYFLHIYGAIISTTISFVICFLFFIRLYKKKIADALENKKNW